MTPHGNSCGRSSGLYGNAYLHKSHSQAGRGATAELRCPLQACHDCADQSPNPSPEPRQPPKPGDAARDPAWPRWSHGSKRSQNLAKEQTKHDQILPPAQRSLCPWLGWAWMECEVTARLALRTGTSRWLNPLGFVWGKKPCGDSLGGLTGLPRGSAGEEIGSGNGSSQCEQYRVQIWVITPRICSQRKILTVPNLPLQGKRVSVLCLCLEVKLGC